MKLFKKPKDFVCAENVPIYLKVNAGTEKIKILTERIRYLLNQKKRGKVLVLTPTHKVIKEIKEQLNDISELDEKVFIGTFYSFCQSVLKHHRHYIGLGKMPYIFENENDRMAFIDQAIAQTPSMLNNYKTKNEDEQKDLKYQALKFISKVKQNLFEESDLNQHTDNPNFILLYQNYQGLLRDQNAIDGDDAILFVYKLFTSNPSIADIYCRSFFAICIDEAHNLNKAQYSLLKTLTKISKNTRKIKNPYQLTYKDASSFNNDNVMFIEDIRPSNIYLNGSSFNDIKNELINDFDPDFIELNENYRLSESVLRAIKKITPNIEEPFNNLVKEGIFELQGLENEKKEASWIVDKINKLISMKEHKDIEGTITYEKIAILARNKYLFNPLEKLFETSNIPFFHKIIPGLIKFESNLVQKLDSVLFYNQQNLSKFDISSDELPILKKLRDYIIKPQSEFKDETHNFQFFEDFKKEIANITKDENERNMILNDINELQKHWKGYKIYPDGDNRPFHQFKNAMILKAPSPSECAGITLATVDAMKGQEFDIVFLMGMDDETFPDYRAIQKEGIDLKQEENNLYVAFTRSKRFLYVTWPKKRRLPWGDEKKRKISRFLKKFDL